MLFRIFACLSALGSVLAALAGLRPLWLVPVVFVGLFAGLVVLSLVFLGVICAFVDLDKPQEQDSPFYRRVMYVYIEAIMNAALVRLHTQGLEKTPQQGRFLLVCNHLFIADPGILLHAFRSSQLAFLTKKENYKLPVIRKFMHKILCQPIDRENDRQALKTILKCIQLVKQDQVSIGAFPEGYTSRDGLLHPFRPGVFKIAQKTGIPIVICTIRNTRQILSDLKKLRFTDVQLHLVEVLQPEDYQGMTSVELSDLVYEKMIGDLGEEFRYHPA